MMLFTNYFISCDNFINMNKFDFKIILFTTSTFTSTSTVLDLSTTLYDSGRNAAIWLNGKDKVISDNGVQLINLKSDIQTSSGDGTKENPFTIG